MSYIPQVFAKTEDRARVGVTRLAQGTGNILGKPKESEAEKPTPAPAPPEVTLDNLLLPDDLIEFLMPPLQKLGFPLKKSTTDNEFSKETINHHSIETSNGKIVLIYVTPEVLESYRSDITILGLLFMEKFRLGAFIFSLAEGLERYYKPTIERWQGLFQKAAIFLQEDIKEFRGMKEEYLQNQLKKAFSLPDDLEETDSGETAAFEHQKLLSQMEKHFNHDELNKLCFDLDPGLSFDDFRGRATLDAAIIALIQHFQRQEQLPRLVEQCKIAVPNADWDVFPKS